MKIQRASLGSAERTQSITVLQLEIGDRIYNGAWIHIHFSWKNGDFKTAGGRFVVNSIDTQGAYLKCAQRYCDATQGPIEHMRRVEDGFIVPNFLNLTEVEE